MTLITPLILMCDEPTRFCQMRVLVLPTYGSFAKNRLGCCGLLADSSQGLEGANGELVFGLG